MMIKKINLIIILFYCATTANTQTIKAIIDADTGNEIDDIPALALAILSDKLDVIGITSAQWNRVEVCGRNTMMESWELNNRLLEYLDVTHIPNLKGSEEMVGKQWAIEPPRPSEATDFIIKHARAAAPTEKLTIIITGAATNIASAIMLDSTIVPKIGVYFIGTQYVPEKQAINKNEFNVRNDLNAFDVLLNTKGLELHIMPANITKGLVFTKDEIYGLQGKNRLSDLIIERWELIASAFDTWIMWDIAIIQAVINPQWASEINAQTPPENLLRNIKIYKSIDAHKMKSDFWEVYHQH